MIAQEVQPLFPDLVTESPRREEEESHLMVGYSDFGLIAIKALQELKAQQDARLTELRDLTRRQQEIMNAQAQQLAAQRAELEELKVRLAGLDRLLRETEAARRAIEPAPAAETATVVAR